MNKKKSNHIAIDIMFILICLATTIPFLLLLAISLSNERDIVYHGYSLIPKNIDLAAYKYLFDNPKEILTAYGFTAYTSIAATAFGVFVMILFAYPLSISTFKFKGFFSKFLFFTMIFNGGTAASYIINTQYLHLSNSPWIFILPAAVNAWNIFMLRTFMQGISYEIIEAAKIDGAGHYRTLFTIVIPLAKPAIATVTLFTVLQHWNDWYTCLLYITNRDMQTVQYMLQTMMENINFANAMRQAGVNVDLGADMIPSEGIRMGMAVIAAGPIIAVFPFFQKYFAKGLTIGSVKG